MDYLLTWNLKHINNAQTKGKIVAVVESQGFECPVLCSPEELGAEIWSKTLSLLRFVVFAMNMLKHTATTSNAFAKRCVNLNEFPGVKS
ncbi:hypothetical protein [Lamprobacter modestohalophilus]|uniref:hypothetical protein n=1 Tax=Lamprobacter modestohalophilus TaxID=1064514 RepID=UPI00190815FB|nr:hypothetical protein [Lamprobacter modestohalophilus]